MSLVKGKQACDQGHNVSRINRKINLRRVWYKDMVTTSTASDADNPHLLVREPRQGSALTVRLAHVDVDDIMENCACQLL
jgi:site-specific recombinase XerD